MGLFEALSEKSVWQEFLEYKLAHRHLTKSEEADLRHYIEAEEYAPVLVSLRAGRAFPLPEKKMIRKMQTDRKRTVYIYPRAENYVLKLLTFLLLRRYDGIFTDSLYSFRIHTGVNKAMRRILSTPGLQQKYTYKVDISNYFNSIPVENMLSKLQPILEGEPEIYQLFENLLREPMVSDRGVPVAEEKGVMAGTPFAVFLANVYLMDLDEVFEGPSGLYARYSDDIIFFADSEEERESGAAGILAALTAHGLTVNPKKEVRTAPGEPWSFLGIGYHAGVVDISPISKEKLKAKLRRRARAIRRWQVRMGAGEEQAVKAYIRALNRKFFDPDSSHELTWSRWYFPVITTDVTLRELDHYAQDWIRYLATGRHSKARYRFDYESMKRLGYVSLVHAWYEGETVKREEI